MTATVQPSYDGALAAALQGRLVDFVRLLRAHDFRVGVAEEMVVAGTAAHILEGIDQDIACRVTTARRA